MIMPTLRPVRRSVLPRAAGAAALALAAATTVLATPAVADPVPVAPYRGVAIQATTPAGSPDLVLDVDGSTTSDGSQIRLRRYTGANDQLWQVVPVGGELFEIRNVHSRSCLDVQSNSNTKANLIQYRCHGGGNQHWKAVALNNRSFQIVAAGSGKCVDSFSTTSDDPVEGADVVQTTCDDRLPRDQRWTFESV